MKIQNFGEEFELTYNSRDVKIPNGVFEVSDLSLGYFIQKIASKWNKNIKIVDESVSADIKKDITKEESKEEPIEEPKDKTEETIKEVKEVIKKDKKTSK
jgi:hypothetical protein